VSEGGLGVALAEACFNPDQRLGVEVRSDVVYTNLFGEGSSTVVISADPESLAALQEIFAPLDFLVLGRVTKESRLRIRATGTGDDYIVDEDVSNLLRLYEEALTGRLSR
jgi:phosphoribosylformylglycinamidine (FGAM) synthase-like enzyme